jgi:hypothetical protein
MELREDNWYYIYDSKHFSWKKLWHKEEWDERILAINRIKEASTIEEKNNILEEEKKKIKLIHRKHLKEKWYKDSKQ